MTMNERLRGLYAITPDRHVDLAQLRSDVEAALAGGARIVQYRDKSGDTERRRLEARVLRDLCSAFAVPFIVNDDVELAVATLADGVHIGRDDGELAVARRRLGEGRLVGVSCYNDFELARQAAAGGADYIAFGSFFVHSPWAGKNIGGGAFFTGEPTGGHGSVLSFAFKGSIFEVGLCSQQNGQGR